MIILDLHSEQFPQYDRLEQYFGQPYIWCMLHNFGGTLGMFGSFDIINQVIQQTLFPSFIYYYYYYSDRFLQETHQTPQ